MKDKLCGLKDKYHNMLPTVTIEITLNSKPDQSRAVMGDLYDESFLRSKIIHEGVSLGPPCRLLCILLGSGAMFTEWVRTCQMHSLPRDCTSVDYTSIRIWSFCI